MWRPKDSTVLETTCSRPTTNTYPNAFHPFQISVLDEDTESENYRHILDVKEGTSLKKILVFVIIFVVGLGAGAGGIITLEPSLLSKTPPPVVQSVPFDAKTAVSVSETGIQSNLSGNNHYVSFDLEFSVMPAALTSAGGTVAGAAGGSGTGSAQLDAEIRNQLIALARATPYSLFSTSGGLTVFKAEVSEILQSIFGPGSIGKIYFSNLLTQ